MPHKRHKKSGSQTQELKNVDDTTNNPIWQLKTSDNLGRYLVAGVDLPAATTIIKEDPLVVGPAQDSCPLCLGCYQHVPDIATAYKCPKCQWSLCSNKCTGQDRHYGHSKEECSTLVKCKVKSLTLPDNKLYNAILPLRCLLLKEHCPEKWNILMSMEAHNDIRKKIPSIWDYNQKSVVDRIQNEWKIKNFTEEEIHTVCGILEVNAFAVGEESLTISALYPTAFLFAHSCVPNTAHTDDDAYRIVIYSAIPLEKGEMITLSYTNSLQGTKKRREHLRQCKFFDCDCARCKDPAELGSYMSALKCTKCSPGHLLATDPLAEDSVWLCDNKKCKCSLTAQEVDRINDRIDADIKAQDRSIKSQELIDALESLIQRLVKVLHKNHYHILGMKYTLSQLYGKSEGYLIHQMNETLLERKREICEDVLCVFDIVEPGFSHIRGFTLYELHAPVMIIAIQRFERRKISKVDLCRRLREVASYLQECCKIFKFEVKPSEQSSIRLAAEDALLQLKSWEPVVGKLYP